MQITDTLLMVRPANFGFNPETASSNAFQIDRAENTISAIKEAAKKEFNNFVSKLKSAGIIVHVIDDTANPLKTDAVFPNNWLTTHSNGTLITYPMLSQNRRLERRADIINALQLKYGYTNHITLESFEEEQKYLEGTGSMVLDRANQIAYACMSPRTNLQVLDRFCSQMGYEKIIFRAVDGLGTPIYHTNVMMAMGEDFVIICLSTLKDQQERNKLLQKFEATHKAVIEINLIQMMAFAGNMMQVKSAITGKKYLVMSQQAFRSLKPEQIAKIESHTQILYSPLEIIETYGGGSARCMMAEVFPPTPK